MEYISTIAILIFSNVCFFGGRAQNGLEPAWGGSEQAPFIAPAGREPWRHTNRLTIAIDWQWIGFFRTSLDGPVSSAQAWPGEKASESSVFHGFSSGVSQGKA
jgi:hypothetical protein